MDLVSLCYVASTVHGLLPEGVVWKTDFQFSRFLIAEETSSSSETSPTDTRKSMPPSMRKSKNKGQFLGKRMMKSTNGYSSHTEETTFRCSNFRRYFEEKCYPNLRHIIRNRDVYSSRINPPSRFSDRPLSRMQNESDLDFRRPSRSSRFTQESSFQIDV